jgi:hypothetical protein
MQSRGYAVRSLKMLVISRVANRCAMALGPPARRSSMCSPPCARNRLPRNTSPRGPARCSPARTDLAVEVKGDGVVRNTLFGLQRELGGHGAVLAGVDCAKRRRAVHRTSARMPVSCKHRPASAAMAAQSPLSASAVKRTAGGTAGGAAASGLRTARRYSLCSGCTVASPL